MWFAIAFFAIFAVVLILYFLKTRAIKKNGFEVDAEISRVDVSEDWSDETYSRTVTVYAFYTDPDDGTRKEALLNGCRREYAPGTPVRIKVHPTRRNQAVLMK